MQVNIDKDNIINEYPTRTISEITIEEYNQISLSLMYRLQDLENRLENFKHFEDRFKDSIEETEKKIEQLKNIILILQ